MISRVEKLKFRVNSAHKVLILRQRKVIRTTSKYTYAFNLLLSGRQSSCLFPAKKTSLGPALRTKLTPR